MQTTILLSVCNNKELLRVEIYFEDAKLWVPHKCVIGTGWCHTDMIWRKMCGCQPSCKQGK